MPGDRDKFLAAPSELRRNTKGRKGGKMAAISRAAAKRSQAARKGWETRRNREKMEPA